MKFLPSIMSKSPVYKALLSDIQKSVLPVQATGLSDIHKAVISYCICRDTGRKVTVITPDESSATSLAEDLAALGANTLTFPSKDFCFGDMTSYSKEYEHKRIDTLSKLLDGDFDILVCSAEATCQYTVPPEILKNSLFNIKSNDSIDINKLSEKLINAGYVRVPQVEGTGQFSVRGGIVDIFPTDSTDPVRIELWGDEIDSMSFFDTESQRRTDNTDLVKISPASEIVFDSLALADKIEAYIIHHKNISTRRIMRLNSDIESLRNGVTFPPDRYINEVYSPATVLNYVADSITVTTEFPEIKNKLKNLAEIQKEDYIRLLSDGYISNNFKYMSDSGEFYRKIENSVFMGNFTHIINEFSVKNLLSFNYKRLPQWRGDTSVLTEDIENIISSRGKCVVLAGEQKAATVLYESLKSKGLKVSQGNADTVKLTSPVTVMTGTLSAGFELTELGVTVITHSGIFTGKKIKKHIKNENGFGSLDELKAGDPVVHISHGIGIFEGINKVTAAGVTKDYIKIRYAKGDVLYLPVTQLDMISRYIGAKEDGSLKLNKLGGEEWARTRARVKKAVKNMAKQLTVLYAKRMSAKGYAFADDTDLQRDFENSFPFVETDDQLRCADEIKKDMQRPIPMDRLLCGDVGFGKTEVALRAAFKCVSEGKQCALLVPTTILAWQHYNTAVNRFGDLPVKVKMLSRFVPKSEQTKTVQLLAEGKVDMVIGTHRLISQDVKFKNIGLVIIDEEQRFGVAQKEKLKELYPFVDVLTLSATPIPRTLNMAMSGLRDMSCIEQAPGDRYPVQTYVMEYNYSVITDAIKRELSRSGQVYYLHNRVESIDAVAAKIKESIPDANVATAHGKMDEEKLSDIWRRLIEHEIDVLVCTTIIETGVDVPNANTLIVEDADRMGLSQLHQLRGRVGRSSRRAYAYLCYKKDRSITEIAEKRLEALREYTEFGAGFKIAMRDLEIRGAGSILGGEQHGNIEAVGYDMYIKLLNDAVNEENGITPQKEYDCKVDLNISAHIPERYISSLPARLGIYKRIASIKNNANRMDVIDELCDRFGEPPKEVLGLINIALIRNKLSQLGVYEISEQSDRIVLKVNNVTPQQLATFNDSFGDKITLSAGEKPYYYIKIPGGKNNMEIIEEIAKGL